ncbi:hypothetical protein GcM1_120001 [Golovinomyces cichoracearum]|uniref:Uncharacterized protein n=1 Tax=Golovinomyces cichoracearum TaxID=62708 RepID=A0A420JBX0_9PEZI|nr:hypothetical protein GcM1_120001 [Golovinomyces cichoracearum]
MRHYSLAMRIFALMVLFVTLANIVESSGHSSKSGINPGYGIDPLAYNKYCKDCLENDEDGVAKHFAANDKSDKNSGICGLCRAAVDFKSNRRTRFGRP